MDDHDPYDPDGDVSRHLYFEDPKPLENDGVSSVLLNHGVVTPQYEVNHGVPLVPSTENRVSFQQYEYNHRVSVSVVESTQNGVPVQQYEVNHGVSVSLLASTQNRDPHSDVNHHGGSFQPLTGNAMLPPQFETNRGVSLNPLTLNGVSVQPYQVNNGVPLMGSSESVRSGSFESFMNAVLERVWFEGSSSSPSWQAVFQQVAPEQLNCFSCSILREVLHSSATSTLSLVVHGEWATIDHAIFDYQEHGDDRYSTNRQLFYVDLRKRSPEWLRSFIDASVTIMKSDQTGQFHDSLASFYDSLCADVDFTMQYASGYHYVEPPAFLTNPSNFEVGESSGTKNENPDQNVDPAFYLRGQAGSSSSHPIPILESQPLQYMPPVNPSNWMAPVEYDPHELSGGSSLIDVSDPSDSESDDDDELPPFPANYPLPNGVTPLALQRRRTASMRVLELTNYLHLPISEAANRLRMCSTALKNICRRNGMERWPSRQIQAIDRHIAKLEREMMNNKKPGLFFKYMEEIAAARQKKMKIYESVLDLMNKKDK